MQSLPHSRRPCNLLTFLVWVFLFSGLPSVFPDRLRLKSGEILQGKAVTVTSTYVEWQDLGKRYKFPHSEVLGIDIGYDGLPACFDQTTFGQEDCAYLVHKLSKTTLQITKQSSPLKLESIPTKKIKYLKINADETLDASRYFEAGVSGIWIFKSKEIKGILKKTENSNLFIESKDSGLEEFPSSEFLSFSLDNRSKLAENLVKETPKVIPGYNPILEKNYKKAGFLFAGALFSAAGMLYEYNQAIAAINSNTQYVPLGDGRIIVVANTFGNDRYDFHRERFYGYTAIFSLILGYTLYDSFFIGNSEPQKNHSGNPVYLRPLVQGFGSTIPISHERTLDKQGIMYGFSFDSKF